MADYSPRSARYSRAVTFLAPLVPVPTGLVNSYPHAGVLPALWSAPDASYQPAAGHLTGGPTAAQASFWQIFSKFRADDEPHAHLRLWIFGEYVRMQGSEPHFAFFNDKERPRDISGEKQSESPKHVKIDQ